MGWKGVTVMDQRIRFLSDYLEGLYPFTDLCQLFGISRKTGYKWVGRYRDYGAEGLEERSRLHYAAQAAVLQGRAWPSR